MYICIHANILFVAKKTHRKKSHLFHKCLYTIFKCAHINNIQKLFLLYCSSSCIHTYYMHHMAYTKSKLTTEQHVTFSRDKQNIPHVMVKRIEIRVHLNTESTILLDLCLHHTNHTVCISDGE